MTDSSLTGDAVHAVLTYLGRHPECDGPIEPHLAAIWNMPGFDRGHFSKDEQGRIEDCWRFMWTLAQEASGFRTELPGETGKQPDLLLRKGNRWEVVEFKTGNVHSANQKSRVQIRDMMAKLKKHLPADAVVEGCRIYLPCAPDMPFIPVRTPIACGT